MRSIIGPWGAVVPVRDAKALAAAMRDAGPLSADEQAAARAAMARFTLARAAPAYAALFREIVRPGM
jgi:glycosyltransferase involved in cell wall biosynthesis